MIRTIVVTAAALAGGLLAQGEPGAGTATQVTGVKELVAQMKVREKAVTSAYLETVSRGPLPGGARFEIEGSVRVLEGTHFHIKNRATFEDVTQESEHVLTPEGVWLREKGPAFGEVYLTMDRELAARFKEARAVLSGAEESANPVAEPAGSAMLESLDQQFELGVQRRLIRGQEYFVVEGPSRGGAANPPEGPSGPQPDRLELLVRIPDLAIVQMTQFKAGAELMTIETKVLELNRPMEKSSFRLELPPGAKFKDVRDHPPAWQQIQQMLRQAEAKRDDQAPKSGESAPESKGESPPKRS